MPGALLLGALTFDRQRLELLQADGAPAPLRRQALQLLRVLAEQPGEVVSKHTLIDRVWPNVIVTEGSLTQAISEIRRLLGDDGHRLLRNVARRGYRLVPDEPPERLPMLSMVVLPFTAEGDARGFEWLANALHGDLIGELARWEGSLVIARETSVLYGPDADPRQLSCELRVRHVLSARLRFEGERLRLQVHRIDAASGMQGSSHTLLVARSELASGMADLALQVVHALEPELVHDAARMAAALAPWQLDAESLTMQASALMFRGPRRENFAPAMQLLQRALALDPERARAWALHARLCVYSLLNGWAADEAAMRRHIDDAAEQLQLVQPGGPCLLGVRAIQAFLREDARAMLRFARALVDVHRYAVNFAALGMAALLCGRAEEATEALQLALRLSPRDPMLGEWLVCLAVARYMADDDEEACAFAEDAFDADPSLPWPPIHAAALWRCGEQAAARRVWQEHEQRRAGGRIEAIARRLVGDQPVLVATRESLIERLRGAARMERQAA
jgi:TolB-like protein